MRLAVQFNSRALAFMGGPGFDMHIQFINMIKNGT